MIEVGAVLQTALHLALAVQHVEHGLHRGVRQVASGQARLHGLNVHRSGLPQNVHDFQFQRGEGLFGGFSSRQCKAPKQLGAYSEKSPLSTKILGHFQAFSAASVVVT
ncbi:hypothetical protein SBA3_220011 [Candidatus Sulfopaludibacter sp. SbA3]|nr:hypothetical protein SBA3_220011 [Candidatus Sulfopaludibacter sp. SbA3]